jgi:hypothetical protein
MHGRGHVAAEIERHADIGVAEHLADDLRVDPAAQKDGCRVWRRSSRGLLPRIRFPRGPGGDHAR